MPFEELSSDATEKLHQWLETNIENKNVRGSAATLLPADSHSQTLLKAFAATKPGASAAPIKVGSTLAEGGMGVVKFAEQKALGRTVVVKTMRGEPSEATTEQILREAWVTGALEHPNIVPVHDIRVDERGIPVIVLKRIEGDCWTALMQEADLVRERFGAANLLEWNLDVLKQVSQAIRFAHSKGILHRDLKPDNVMIGGFGEVYLVDWGIALRLQDNDQSPLPSAKHQEEMAGTPCYLAPEMLGNAPLDARTDIYLLGSVLYEILAGSPPHNTESIESLIRDIRASAPPFPDCAPLGLKEICKKAMAAAPSERYQDAKAFMDALRTYLQRQGSQQVAQEALRLLQILKSTLLSESPDRHEIYRGFGALRFGFESSLRSWPHNRSAQKGLQEAREFMVQFELDSDNPVAAQSILSELQFPSEELQRRVESKLKANENQQAELSRYRDNSNPALGSRTRLGILGMLGALWTTLPLLQYLAPQLSLVRTIYRDKIIASILLWAISGALWFWARESLTKTEFNRKLSWIVALCFPAQILLFMGAYWMRIPQQFGEILMQFLWALIAATAVVVVEVRFWPAVVVYAIGFLVASYAPEQRFLLMSIGHFTMTLNGFLLWRSMRHQSDGSSLPAQDSRQS